MLPGIFSEFDVLLAPSTAGEAPAGIAATGDPSFNRIWTLLHVPVVHVPVGSGPRGLPVGLTVAGAVGADRAALRAAEWIHARLGGSE
jgi:amidase